MLNKMIFNKKILYLIIIGLLAYILYLHPGRIDIKWYNYEIITSVFHLLIIFVVIIFVTCLVTKVKKLYIKAFAHIKLNEVLVKHVKYFNTESFLHKAIHQALAQNITDLKSLKLFAYLNELLDKGLYDKSLRIVKRSYHSADAKTRNLLIYIKIEAMFLNNKIEVAKELCLSYLYGSSISYESKAGLIQSDWLFLKLLYINLTKNTSLEEFKLLKQTFMTKVSKAAFSEDTYKKIYCLINYKIVELTHESDWDDEVYGNLKVLIKKYPDFIPAYNLIVKILLARGKFDEIQTYVVKSWQNFIGYENLLPFTKVLSTDSSGIYIKEIQKLMKVNDPLHRQKAIILSSVYHGVHNQIIAAKEALQKVEALGNLQSNKDVAVLYNMIKLFTHLKEANTKSFDEVLKEFVHYTNISWWSLYIKL